MTLPQTAPAARPKSRPSTDYWDVNEACWRRVDEYAAPRIPTPRRGN
jgi:hypothetical protein